MSKYYYHDDDEEDLIDRPPSKTQRKNAMHELQALGETLVNLPADALKKTLAKLDLPETLVDALREGNKMTKLNEAKRRQVQYVGKLMRDIDPAPIREALDVLKGASVTENAKMHRLERLREQLLADEKFLTEIGNAYPGADLGQLRQLRRNALKETELNKPPKSFRQIYQVLRALEEAKPDADDGEFFADEGDELLDDENEE
jgi:ribosome-associated protein